METLLNASSVTLVIILQLFEPYNELSVGKTKRVDIYEANSMGAKTTFPENFRNVAKLQARRSSVSTMHSASLAY